LEKERRNKLNDSVNKISKTSESQKAVQRKLDQPRPVAVSSYSKGIVSVRAFIYSQAQQHSTCLNVSQKVCFPFGVKKNQCHFRPGLMI